MTSWFGSGRLSEITGQISNFTKEVLTEGSEEVDDHATELRVAKAKLAEMEAICLAQKAELERQQQVNNELADTVQSSELQINAISNEYRGLLDQKEMKLKDMQEKHEDMLHLNTQMLEESSSAILGGTSDNEPASLTPSSSTSLTHSQSVPSLLAGFPGDSQDFDDVISLQRELNRLRGEVQRAEGECRHWRQLASTKSPSPEEKSVSEDLTLLKTQLKEVKQQLSDEIDQHQHERAALQDVHSQKVSTLKKRHKEEVTELRQRLHACKTQDETDGDVNDRERHLESVNQKLSHDLEHTHAADRSKARHIEELDKQSSQIQTDRDRLVQEQEKWETECRELREQVDVMGEERQHMKQQLLQLSQQLQHQKENPDLSGFVTCASTPMKAVSSQSLTSAADTSLLDLTAQNDQLQQQLTVCQDEIDQFDMVRTDWLMEKEALEEVLVKLREQLKAKTSEQQSEDNEESNGSTQQLEDEIASLQENLESKIFELTALATKLKAKEEGVQNVSLQLEQAAIQLQQLQEKKETIEEEMVSKDATIQEQARAIQDHQQQLQDKEEQLADVSTALERSLVEHGGYTELQEKYDTLGKSQAGLEEERNSLVANLEELDEQNQQAMGQIIISRDKLSKENDHLREKMGMLEKEIASEAPKQEAVQNEEKEALIKNLTKENEKLDRELTEMNEKNKKAALSLNDLHMDKQELQEKVKACEQKISILAGTEQRCWKLEEEIAEVLAAQRAEVEAQGGDAELTVSRLQAELGEAHSKAGSLQNRVSDLEAEVEGLYSAIKSLKVSNQKFGNESQASRQSHAAIIEVLTTEHQEKFQDLQEKMCSLQTKNESLVNDIEQVSQKMAAQASHYEKCISELQYSKQGNSDSLQEDHDRLVKEGLEKDMRMSELAAEVHKLENNVQTFILQEENLIETANSKEQENLSLRMENTTLNDLVAQHKHQVGVLEQELSKIQASLKEYENVTKMNEHEVSQLKEQLEQQEAAGQSATETLEKEVAQLESQLESKHALLQLRDQEAEALKEQLHAHNQELLRLEEKSQETNSQLKLGKETIKNLENTIQNLTDKHSQKVQEIIEAQGNTKELGQSLKDVIGDELGSNRGSSLSRTSSMQSLQNGDIECETPKHYKMVMKEVDKLRSILSQKDEVINQMKDSHASLLNLLEERSLAVHGNKVLVDIHRLEGEVRSLRKEKEQMMSILNEKSRECSAMKSEVHKLMGVISAEKTALSKLQQDNQELMKRQGAAEVPNQEMTKEAVRKLSQIIRDKDLEIESLGMKNQSLLQLLQENHSGSSDSDASGASGAQLSSIVLERDNLAKQLAVFQADREQIVAALNAKHQESMIYHAEIQRLSAILSTEAEKQDRLQQEFGTLSQQFEDKQQSLLKSQNELLNYKQKYSDLNTNYHRVVQQQRNSRASSPSPRDSPVPPHTEGGADSSAAKLTSESMQFHPPPTQGPTQSEAAMAQELEDIKAVLQSHESAFAGKDKLVFEKEALLREKDQKILLRDSTISEKDRLLAETNSRLHHIEHAHHIKESEINNSRKQHEHLTFQLQGATKELVDLRQEVEHLTQQNSTLQQEMTAGADANSRLTLALNNKDFELSSMQEKITTLTELLKAAEGGETKQSEGGGGEMARLRQEVQGARQQAQTIQQERDQLHLALQQTQADAHQAHQQLERLSQRNQKLEQEVQRLRQHLLQVEEGYTAEALASEDREKDLRNRLATAEEKALTSASAVHNANQSAVQQVEQLQMQLYAVAEQRDSALLQLASSQETSNQYATSLANLQSVLEQFQMEKETMLSAEIERYQREANVYKGENNRLVDDIRQLKVQLDDTTEALEAAQRLSEQLDRKEEMIAALREEVQLREIQLNHAEEELQKLTSSTEAKVDKDLLKNMVLGYFHTNSGKQREALRLIGRVLDFSPQEMEEVGAGEGGGGWLGGLFKRAAPTPPSTPVRKTGTSLASALTDTSFSELFVKFLEKESSPTPTMKLPTERMISEQQKRHQDQQQHHKQPAFNPFSATMHSSVPLVAPGHQSNSTESHLLMKPISSSLPMFSATPGPMVAPSSDSPSGSGRSTPASSGAFLKEVLQR